MDKLLSVCMIVRDEEKVIDRCLKSIYNIADEIIVVDTGSLDNTKEIVLNYTDDLYEFEWIDDFSKARNYAASKATSEWILVLDADEYVDREDFKRFKKGLQLNPPKMKINAIEIASFTGHEAETTALNKHSRLYKNNGDIKFIRPIHEILTATKGSTDYGIVDLKIFHTGYMRNAMEEKGKSDRNLSILLEQKDKKGIDYFYIANEYNTLGEVDKAIKNYQIAYRNRESIDVNYLTKLLIFLIDALYRKERYIEAKRIIEDAEQAYPHLADYKYYKGLIYLKGKDEDRAKRVFEYMINNTDKLKADHSVEQKEYLPLIYLAGIYEKEDNIQKAVEYYSRAISLNQSNDGLWSKLLYLLGKHSPLEELTDFINRKVVPAHNMTEKRMVQILLNTPLLNVQKLSRSLLDHDELLATENEALWLKNYFLDNNYEEVDKILSEQTLGETIVMLRMNIFTLADYFIQLYEHETDTVKEVFTQIVTQNNLSNLAKVLFEERHGKLKLNNTERNIFVNIYRQAKVLGSDEIVEKLDKKMFLLNDQLREEINNIRNL